jgi:tetratricopeptide (TPR) repeat protein
MADKDTAEKELSEAWAHHRAGRHQDALRSFEQILKSQPSHADALFGLGLAQRSLGQVQAALDSFEKAQQVTQKALDNNPGEDRYEMSLRMIGQRISEIQQGTLVKLQ